MLIILANKSDIDFFQLSSYSFPLTICMLFYRKPYFSHTLSAPVDTGLTICTVHSVDTHTLYLGCKILHVSNMLAPMI